MADFLNRRYSSEHTIPGFYIEYLMVTDSYATPIPVDYREISGFNEIIETPYGDFQVNSSNLKVGILDNITPKAQDLFEDVERRKFRITNREDAIYENPYLNRRKGRIKFQEKILSLDI